MARTEIELYGMKVTFRAVTGDWEGDPSVPGGTRSIPAYPEDMEITAPDGTDITEWFTDEAMERFANDAMDAFGDMGEREYDD